MPVPAAPAYPETTRRLQRAAVAAAMIAASMLAACSSDNDGDDDLDLIEAFAVVGQSDFLGASPNRGGGAGAGTLAQPLGNVATDGTRLFVADTANNRVLGYSAIPSTDGVAADIVLGQADFTSNVGATGRSRMALPASVFIGEGRLVVADSGNNRVLIWNSVPTQTGAVPDIVVGQSAFDSSGSGTSQTRLAFPTSAVIANGRLLVADQNNNRVLVWNSLPTTNGAAADIVLGQPDFVTRVADDEAEEMNRPASVWSDGFRLLVADSGNHRILAWSLFPQEIGAEADYVIGQSDFSRSSPGTSASTLRTPFGISADGTRIYVADSGNNRVLQFDSFPIANGVQASRVFGQNQDSFSAATANDEDQDGVVDDTPSAGTVSGASGAFIYNGVLYVSDRNNNRVLLFPQ
ncbi:MAG: NHL repeat-containing protein [Pseudomonadota bacterium]|nr:NHL repeat-containing protein [Pseudomonadota bacterium]